MTMQMKDSMLPGLMKKDGIDGMYPIGDLGGSGEIAKTDDMGGISGIVGFGGAEALAMVDGDSLAMTGTECSFAGKRDLAMVGGDN